MQELFPGAVALASIGCGADANPKTGVVGDDVEECAAAGRELAEEIKSIAKNLKPITSRLVVASAPVAIPFDTPRTREEWETRAGSGDAAVAYQAKVNLARLDRGQALAREMLYLVQTWSVGDQLAIVFLPGETVVDYSHRIKREFDRSRIWVNGYSNEERCYVASERILKEGGYEGGSAMVYYDRPQRFAPGIEAHDHAGRLFTGSKRIQITRAESKRHSPIIRHRAFIEKISISNSMG